MKHRKFKSKILVSIARFILNKLRTKYGKDHFGKQTWYEVEFRDCYYFPLLCAKLLVFIARVDGVLQFEYNLKEIQEMTGIRIYIRR